MEWAMKHIETPVLQNRTIPGYRYCTRVWKDRPSQYPEHVQIDLSTRETGEERPKMKVLLDSKTKNDISPANKAFKKANRHLGWEESSRPWKPTSRDVLYYSMVRLRASTRHDRAHRSNLWPFLGAVLGNTARRSPRAQVYKKIMKANASKTTETEMKTPKFDTPTTFRRSSILRQQSKPSA